MPALVERLGPFIRTTEGRWRDLFLDADAMSEGGVKDERNGERVWYGSTSLILGLPVETPVEERALLRALAEKDVHVHVHALRCATREAQSRAPAMLGRTSCELRFSDDPRGLRIDVDVQAPLIERRSIKRTGP
jgi:cold shock CspA family protein